MKTSGRIKADILAWHEHGTFYWQYIALVALYCIVALYCYYWRYIALVALYCTTNEIRGDYKRNADGGAKRRLYVCNALHFHLQFLVDINHVLRLFFWSGWCFCGNMVFLFPSFSPALFLFFCFTQQLLWRNSRCSFCIIMSLQIWFILFILRAYRLNDYNGVSARQRLNSTGKWKWKEHFSLLFWIHFKHSFFYLSRECFTVG